MNEELFVKDVMAKPFTIAKSAKITEALDKMLDEALRLPEGPGQTKLYSQIQKLIVEEAPMLFLYHAIRMAAYSDRVQGLELNLAALPHDKLVKVDLAQ